MRKKLMSALGIAAVVAVQLGAVGCDHIRSKGISGEQEDKEAKSSAPHSTVPSSDRYGSSSGAAN